MVVYIEGCVSLRMFRLIWEPTLEALAGCLGVFGFRV